MSFNVSTVASSLALVAVSTVSAGQHQWSDDFDSYPQGPLVGVGGWEAWDDDPETADFLVGSGNASSQPQALEIDSFDDAVHQFSDVDDGKCVFEASMYVPSDATGAQHVSLLNTYPATEAGHWSLDLAIDADGSTIGDAAGEETLPLVRDAWSSVRVIIDLDQDHQSVYYEDELLVEKAWLAHVEFGAAVTALSLRGNGASIVYYDDLRLEPCTGNCACAADTNGDGFVNVDDLLNVILLWGTSDPSADIVADGVVNSDDLVAVIIGWGDC